MASFALQPFTASSETMTALPVHLLTTLSFDTRPVYSELLTVLNTNKYSGDKRFMIPSYSCCLLKNGELGVNNSLSLMSVSFVIRVFLYPVFK